MIFVERSRIGDRDEHIRLSGGILPREQREREEGDPPTDPQHDKPLLFTPCRYSGCAARRAGVCHVVGRLRSEEHTSDLQSLMRISYAVFPLKKKRMPH